MQTRRAYMCGGVRLAVSRCAVALAAGVLGLASSAAAQRDPEVDVRARLFPEVTAGVAAMKSRVVRTAGVPPSSAQVASAPAVALPLSPQATPATGVQSAPGTGKAASAPGAAKDAAAPAASTSPAPAEERLYYLLLPGLHTTGSAGATILVFRADGTRVAQIPAPPAVPSAVPSAKSAAGAATAADLQAVQPAAPLVVYGHDFDVDAQGRVFLADRAANAIRIFNADGTPAGSISVVAPTSVAALATGEVAVTSLRSNKLITVYAEHPAATGDRPAASGWRAVREFGEPASIADSDAPADLNRFLNIGRLARDSANQIYYAFAYAPEPTVRKYDAYGYKLYESELATLDFLASAQTARRNIDRLGQERFTLGPLINPGFKPTVTALAPDPQTQELFVAIGAQLLHFDRDGVRKQTYRLFTKDGARVEASAILVEPDRLLIASETQGVFEFPRPDKPKRPGAAN